MSQEFDDLTHAFAELLSKLQSANDDDRQAAMTFAIDSLLMAFGSIEHRLDALERSNDITRGLPRLARPKQSLVGQKRVGFKKSDRYDFIRRFLRRSIWWLFHRRQANFAALTSSLAGVIQGLPQSPWGHAGVFPPCRQSCLSRERRAGCCSASSARSWLVGRLGIVR